MQEPAREAVQSESDEQLMGRVMLGDRVALSLLVERHHSPLMGYLYRLVGGARPLAEDLVQETFIRIITSKSYRQTQPFKPWLYAIATNLARDHFKAAETRHSAGSHDTLEETLMVEESPGPEDRVVQAETGVEVASTIGRLPIEYRSALLLRFYGDMSLREIADTLGIPVGTVKSRLSVGCRRLRHLLAGVLNEQGQGDVSKSATGGQGGQRG